MPYLGVRFSSENWGGALFFISLAWLMLQPKKKSAYVMIGLLLGAAIACRYQTGFLIAGLALWLMVKRSAWRNTSNYLMLIGSAIGLALSILADRWLYGEWTFTAWNYARVNIVEDMASQFGTAPWYYYFAKVLERAYPLMGILIILATFNFWWKHRDHPITWSSLVFVLVHLLVPHKELRFLFPLIFMIPLAVALLAGTKGFRWIGKPVVITLLLLINLPFLLYKMTSAASDHIHALQVASKFDQAEAIKLYHSVEDPYDPFGLQHRFYKSKDGFSIEKVSDRYDLGSKFQSPASTTLRNFISRIQHLLRRLGST